MQPTHKQTGKIDAYLDLLDRYNALFNLTGVKEKNEYREKLITPALEFAALIPEAVRVADVGSGNGIPGIVLAIVTGNPITLIEKNRKKAAFLNEVKYQLGLGYEVIASAVEAVRGEWDVIVGYKVAAVTSFIDHSGHLVADGGMIIYPVDDPKKYITGKLVDKSNRVWYYQFVGKYMVARTKVPRETDVPRGTSV